MKSPRKSLVIFKNSSTQIVRTENTQPIARIMWVFICVFRFIWSMLSLGCTQLCLFQLHRIKFVYAVFGSANCTMCFKYCLGFAIGRHSNAAQFSRVLHAVVVFLFVIFAQAFCVIQKNAENQPNDMRIANMHSTIRRQRLKHSISTNMLYLNCAC